MYLQYLTLTTTDNIWYCIATRYYNNQESVIMLAQYNIPQMMDCRLQSQGSNFTIASRSSTSDISVVSLQPTLVEYATMHTLVEYVSVPYYGPQGLQYLTHVQYEFVAQGHQYLILVEYAILNIFLRKNNTICNLFKNFK